MNGVCVCVRVATPTLKVLPTYETAIDIDIRRAYRAYFLEVEVKNSTIDLQQLDDIVKFDC